MNKSDDYLLGVLLGAIQWASSKFTDASKQITVRQKNLIQ